MVKGFKISAVTLHTERERQRVSEREKEIHRYSARHGMAKQGEARRSKLEIGK